MAKATAEERANFVARQKGWEPMISEESYVTDLMHYLNYHNRNTEYRVIRKWALSMVASHSQERQRALDKASDYELRTIGVIAHAESRGMFVSPAHSTKIRLEVQRLIEKYTSSEITKSAFVVDHDEIKKQAQKADREQQEYSKHKAEVDAAIDDYIKNAQSFSMRGYIASASVNKAIASRLAKAYEPLLAELQAALNGTDKDLKEAYSYLGKIKLRHLIAMVQLIISDCAQACIAAKAPRKPRAKKEKPAGVLVAKLKYLKEFEELKLKSEVPTALVGASTVWLYDTKRRKVSVYEALDGDKISVKGTTLIGWDVTKSSCKTLRKPAEFVNGNLAKRAIAATYKGLKTKEGRVNGRTNEDTIILKVF
jgi:hypothetical protein